MNVWLGSVKPSCGQLCVQVDHPNPSPISHDSCMVRTPPLLLWQAQLAYLYQVQCHNSIPQYPESLSHRPVAVRLVLTHQHHQLQHLPFLSSHGKEQADSYFKLSLCLFSIRSLDCLELFSNSHVRVFDSRQLVQPPV
jgi:hypothetical protein